MFPPSSPLTERTRIRNERLLAENNHHHAAKTSLPGKALIASFLSRLSVRRPEIQRTERPTAKPCYELEA